MFAKIHIGNISANATESDLLRYLSDYIGVQDINFIGQPDSIGFAFVTLENDSEANKAVKLLDGSCFMNQALKVSLARERRNYSTAKISNPIVEKVILPKPKTKR